MPRETPIYVVDDDDAVLDAIGFQLRTMGYKVTGFASGVDFLREATNLEPGILILDIRMPDIDGLEVQRQLAERRLSFAIIMITGHGDISVAVRSMRAGAVDFVEKPFSEETILRSIALAEERRAPATQQDARAKIAQERLGRLAPREREVLEGLVAGQPNKVIAYELGLSPRTVETHRARLMDKMQAGSLSELVRLALVAGIYVKS